MWTWQDLTTNLRLYQFPEVVKRGGVSTRPIRLKFRGNHFCKINFVETGILSELILNQRS